MPLLAPFVGGFGAPELLIILAIVVVLFGASRIGDIGGAIGRGIREFRREVKTGQEEEKEPPKAETAAKADTPEENKSGPFTH